MSAPKQEKVPKPHYTYMEEDGEKYREAAFRLMESYCPRIYQCRHCTYPVIDGYCCHRCGSESP